MPATIRIGNAHGFWGDRLEAASEMLAVEPDLDFVTLDFLAEVSMSIMAAQQKRDASAGYAMDFLEVVDSLTAYWKQGGRCRVVTNAGGLNPKGCAEACRDLLMRRGCVDRKIAVVSGDDVLQILKDDAASTSHAATARNLDTGEAIGGAIGSMLTANAYLGAAPIAEALDRGADLVITGRVADPSLTVGPCLHHFKWRAEDFDRIAGATVAGHLIECGTQVTGGISTDWLSVPGVSRIGFPIVEILEDGSCVVTKPRASGGWVTEATVKEQLLYEIGDPGNYLSPDVTVSFLSIRVTHQDCDRVRVSGAKGKRPPETYKVSATVERGFRAAGQLTIIGDKAQEKASRAAAAVLDRLQRSGIAFQEQIVETLAGDSEALLRIAVADPSRAAIEKFSRSMMPLVTCGPQGTTGYAEGRPKVRSWIGFWPCLIDCNRVQPMIEMLPCGNPQPSTTEPKPTSVNDPEVPPENASDRNGNPESAATGTLAEIALARSGDKGIHANIGVIARDPRDYDRLLREVTVARVADHLQVSATDVTRFELPNLSAINFLVRGILENPLRLDAQGKALGQILLRLPLLETQRAR